MRCRSSASLLSPIGGRLHRRPRRQQTRSTAPQTAQDRGGPWPVLRHRAIAWTTFVYNGIPVPDSFATILATIAGGLVGVLAPTGGPARPSPPSQEQRPSAEQ